jgi:hypothetical protein
MHRKFGALQHGGSYHEQQGCADFTGYSAGSHLAGRIHPLALRQLEIARLPTANLRSKSWEEFAVAGAPELNLFSPFVIMQPKKFVLSGLYSR